MLPHPASEHGVKQRWFRVQMDDPVHQLQVRRTGQIYSLSQRNPLASDTSLLRERRINAGVSLRSLVLGRPLVGHPDRFLVAARSPQVPVGPGRRHPVPRVAEQKSAGPGHGEE